MKSPFSRTLSHPRKTLPPTTTDHVLYVTIRLDVLAHHGNHQVEQTNGFDEGKTQNGVREELTTEGRVTGDTEQESAEHETDTDTG